MYVIIILFYNYLKRIYHRITITNVKHNYEFSSFYSIENVVHIV